MSITILNPDDYPVITKFFGTAEFFTEDGRRLNVEALLIAYMTLRSVYFGEED